jgi:hypothetical protein
MDKVTAIQGLHSDLIALSESQFGVVDRLLSDLDAHVEALRKLLHHAPTTAASRDQVLSGMLTFLSTQNTSY